MNNGVTDELFHLVYFLQTGQLRLISETALSAAQQRATLPVVAQSQPQQQPQPQECLLRPGFNFIVLRSVLANTKRAAIVKFVEKDPVFAPVIRFL